MLEPNKVRGEMRALQSHFMEKRDYVIGRLQNMGFDIPYKPNSTFYLWLDLSQLPESIRDGLNFFQACLEEKVSLKSTNEIRTLVLINEIGYSHSRYALECQVDYIMKSS